MKKYIITIGIIFVFIGVTIGFASNISTEKENDYFVYVKDNALTLWNQTDNQKYILKSNFDPSQTLMLSMYTKFSFDKSKIIYADNIENNYVDLKYVDITNIAESAAKTIVEDVLIYDITANGLVYVKDMNLYYYDYVDSKLVTSSVGYYAVTSDKESVYYVDENKDAYQVNLDNFKTDKINSNIDGIGVYSDLILLYQKEDALLTLYDDTTLVSDKVVSILYSEGNSVYFIRYEGDLEEFKTEEDYLKLNTDVATYRYQNGEVIKIGDGILNLGNGFTDVNQDEYLVLGKYNGSNYDLSFYNQNTKEIFKLGTTDKYNIYGYDDHTKTVYYQGEDKLFYQAKLVDNHLTEHKLIGEDIAYFIKNNQDIYYVENKTANLYSIKDKNNLIVEDLEDWFIIDNVLYYLKNSDNKLTLNCYNCNMNEITNIDSVTNIDNQIFYFKDNNLVNDTLLGNLYVVLDGKSVLIDNNVAVNYSIISIE